VKTLNITIVAFAILAFSGCYTQLMVYDTPETPANAKPLVAEPAPDAPVTEVYYIADPRPVYVPVYVTGPVGGVYHPPAPAPVYTAPAPAPPQRTTGIQRSSAEASQSSSQNTSRNSGATRSGGR
jgi:hypothetical protein